MITVETLHKTKPYPNPTASRSISPYCFRWNPVAIRLVSESSCLKQPRPCRNLARYTEAAALILETRIPASQPGNRILTNTARRSAVNGSVSPSNAGSYPSSGAMISAGSPVDSPAATQRGDIQQHPLLTGDSSRVVQQQSQPQQQQQSTPNNHQSSLETTSEAGLSLNDRPPRHVESQTVAFVTLVAVACYRFRDSMWVKRQPTNHASPLSRSGKQCFNFRRRVRTRLWVICHASLRGSDLKYVSPERLIVTRRVASRQRLATVERSNANQNHEVMSLMCDQ
ncbi:unnamed protein product [Soboliphyme baturini]|uniref:Uncharacterized protein n=1 Tax=Soboliphyme baturini TaxID=241478 RepID=A0A183IHV1_9BILA|nr:unnamed protein product [Soboliphyme baturini]